jgi:hypothetical protein
MSEISTAVENMDPNLYVRNIAPDNTRINQNKKSLQIQKPLVAGNNEHKCFLNIEQISNIANHFFNSKR